MPKFPNSEHFLEIGQNDLSAILGYPAPQCSGGNAHMGNTDAAGDRSEAIGGRLQGTNCAGDRFAF